MCGVLVVVRVPGGGIVFWFVVFAVVGGMFGTIYVVGVFGPLMTIPQVIKIWGDKTAAGVSLLSWVSYLFVAVFWVVYGVMHKEKPIIVTYSTWIILEIMVVAGIILYG